MKAVIFSFTHPVAVTCATVCLKRQTVILSMLLAKEAINTSAEFKVTYKYLMYLLIPIYYRLLSITNIIKYI